MKEGAIGTAGRSFFVRSLKNLHRMFFLFQEIKKILA